MLKIKDEIELKKLEKFGFEKIYFVDDFVYSIVQNKGFYSESIIIWEKDRNIQVTAIDLLDTLYDLIQADLVVKIDE